MPPPGYDRNRITVTVGDDDQLNRPGVEVPRGQALARATWTVKRSLDDPDSAAVWKKVVTVTDAPGIGQIENPGVDSRAFIRFDYASAETLTLTPGVEYLYDIELVSTAGKTKTIEKGTLVAEGQITQS